MARFNLTQRYLACLLVLAMVLGLSVTPLGVTQVASAEEATSPNPGPDQQEVGTVLLALVNAPPYRASETGSDTCAVLTATVLDSGGALVPTAPVYFRVQTAITGGIVLTDTVNNMSTTYGYPNPLVGTCTEEITWDELFGTGYTPTPGVHYYARAWWDLNGNGQWDTGSEPISQNTVEVWWDAPRVAEIDITPSVAVNNLNEQNRTHTVTIDFLDQFGQPISATGTINITPTTYVSSPSPLPVTFSSITNTVFTYQSSRTPTQAGDDIITVTAYASTGTDTNPTDPTPCTGTATKTWYTPSPDHFTVTPTFEKNDVLSGTTHTITVEVFDQYNQPVTGTIHVEVNPGGTPYTATPTYTGTGSVWSFAYSTTRTISSTQNTLGTDTIMVSVDGISGSQDVQKLWTYNVQPSLQIDPLTDTNTLYPGKLNQHTVTVTVVDQFGWPIQAAYINFTVDPTTYASPSTATYYNVSTAAFTYTSSRPPVGDDVITITASGSLGAGRIEAYSGWNAVPGTATKTWTYTPLPTTITVTPSTATNTVGETHTITIVVKDQFGELVDATSTPLAQVSSGPNQGLSLSVTRTDTGIYTATYTSTQVGTDVVTVTVTGATNSPATVTKTWKPGPVAQIFVTPASSKNRINPLNPAPVTHTLAITLKDTYGNLIQGDQAVEIGISGVYTTNFTTTVTNFTTTVTVSNGQGTYSYSYDGSYGPGLDTITCTVVDTQISTTATKYWSWQETLAGPSSFTYPGMITCTVYGYPGDTIVAYHIVDSNGGSHTPIPSITTGTTTLDRNGEFVFSFDAPTFTTTVNVYVRLYDWADGSYWDLDIKVNIVAPYAQSLTLSPSYATNTVGETHYLTATLLDNTNHPLNGQTISFTITGSHPQTLTGVTNGAGQAVVSYTATTPGTDYITASYNGSYGNLTSAQAIKVWQAGPADHFTVTPTSAMNLIEQTHTLTIEVFDRYDNHTTGTVTAFVSDGVNQGLPLTVSWVSEGLYTATYTSTRTGSDTITVQVDSLQTILVTKTWVPKHVAITEVFAPDFTSSCSQGTFTATASDPGGTWTLNIRDPNGDLVKTITGPLSTTFSSGTLTPSDLFGGINKGLPGDYTAEFIVTPDPALQALGVTGDTTTATFYVYNYQVKILDYELYDQYGNLISTPTAGQPFNIRVQFENLCTTTIPTIFIPIRFTSGSDIQVAFLFVWNVGPGVQWTSGTAGFTLASPGNWTLWISAWKGSWLSGAVAYPEEWTATVSGP